MPEEKEIKKGEISVETAHIFPVIKKWMYSEKEIFVREIVSNATDAVTKLKRLSSLSKAPEYDDYKIKVTVNKDESTITVSDNGIGMTKDEIERYICQIALSGALEFVEKYDTGNDGKTDVASGIIGHFGLGFYSSFMIADKVEVLSRSFEEEGATRFICDDEGGYEMIADTRDERGTDVIMHVNDDESEYLNKSKIKEILQKYCSFMPVPIFLTDGGEEEQINDTSPLWLKNASDCTDEEYADFYNKVFADGMKPLFQIHLNADYPLNFKGILYFPKIDSKFRTLEGQVKLYYNQVFVADNIKEVIPEYLLILKGVLDCPELPLNVSRSYLQKNTYVEKLSQFIVKKVADKINSLFDTKREDYEKMWDDLKLFFKYASLCDEKFFDKVKDSALLKTTEGKYLTTAEYLEGAKETNENVIYYTTDPTSQAQYIKILKDNSIEVVVFDHMLDTEYASRLEIGEKIKFLRVDSDIAGAVKGEGEELSSEKLIDMFKKLNDNMEVKFENLRDKSVPAVIISSEEDRRMNDMMKMYGMNGNIPYKMTLVLNASSDIIKDLSERDDETAKTAVSQIYDLALLSHRGLSADELTAFLNQSYRMIEKGLGI